MFLKTERALHLFKNYLFSSFLLFVQLLDKREINRRAVRVKFGILSLLPPPPSSLLYSIKNTNNLTIITHTIVNMIIKTAKEKKKEKKNQKKKIKWARLEEVCPPEIRMYLGRDPHLLSHFQFYNIAS